MRHLLLIFLYRADLVDEVVESLVELEIGDALVLEGTPMERVLAEDVPIFGGLWQTIGDDHRDVRLIAAPLPDRGLVDPLFRLLGEVGVDLADRAVGRVLLLPAEFLEPPSG
jgi:hypothetical protein